MHIEIISSDKDSAEFTLDNQTVAELFRIYLNQIEGVTFAAWRKEHPFKPMVMRITTSGISVKKAISEATSIISKELSELESIFKKK